MIFILQHACQKSKIQDGNLRGSQTTMGFLWKLSETSIWPYDANSEQISSLMMGEVQWHS